MSKLFTPFRLKNLELKNRIAMSPMCMYSAGDDGQITDWHQIHYATRAIGGIDLILQEATAVEKRGRITANDLGIWDDTFVADMKKFVKLIHSLNCKIAIQLAHAGRKCEVKNEKIIAPSAIKWNENYPIPTEMNKKDIRDVIISFTQAATRAVLAGYDAIEIHAAHGYLIHEFLSPLSNHRNDEYGGNTINRTRLLQEILTEIKKIIPTDMPIFIRVSATDYVKGGLNIDETMTIIDIIKDLVDIVDCSTGGLLSPRIDLYPGYQIKFAEKIKNSLNIPTAAIGLITRPEMAEEIVGNERADLVLLGRVLLRQPYWPMYAAHILKADFIYPTQYIRGKY
ncbi:MAG: NADPH dehydrogenase NamA [Bacteroidales bacterium]|jgi:NADPH2 dehydrogenase|nr:NADPH dehydrogenase NamA [Bacteroidales bacterium]MDI9575320.1 NADPH dehydrogenase NamA [Bacteroidota bacterium]MDY0400598.1 NADPH dehydrogenase NamA [Bacteroidales bacterium]HHW59695.1 NADPH dehydrogenase NamA [Bacteroidales bacterium]HOB78061.1 NADPH dehydrogenase NamA [Bacteroidales bacterium]